MNLLIQYIDLQTSILFEVEYRQEILELKVLEPVRHTCNKSFKDLTEIARRLNLTDWDTALFVKAFTREQSYLPEVLSLLSLSDIEKHLFLTEYSRSMSTFSRFIEPLSFTIDKRDIVCSCS